METLRERGITDLAVLRAIDLTPRHVFVPPAIQHRAYEDAALPIGNGQTISQPSVHARYLSELQAHWTRARAGDRHGVRIPDRAAVASRGAGILDRASPRAARPRARGHSARRRPEHLAAPWRRDAGLAGVRPIRRDSRERRRHRTCRGRSSSSSPKAAGSSSRWAAREEQMLTVATRRGDSLGARDIAPVRFVPLVGTYGWAE